MTPAPISVDRLKEVVRFLCGEGELDGYTFGEGPVVGKVTRRYWWRAKLVEAVSVVPALLHQLAERDAEVERLTAECNDRIRQALENGQAFHAAERARNEACGLLREVASDYGARHFLGDDLDDRIAAFLAASGGRDEA